MVENNAFAQDQDNSSNPLGTVLRFAAGLTPLAAASASAYQSIASNNPITPIKGIAQESVGQAIGKNLRSRVARNTAAERRSTKAVLDKLMQEDTVQKIFQNVSQQNALIQSLLNFLSDPTNGLDPAHVSSYRENLLNIMNNMVTEDQAKEAISAVVNAVNRSPSMEAQLRWESDLREFQGLGAQLTPPGKPTAVQNAWSTINPTSLKGKAKERYQTLLKSLGGNTAEAQISLVKRYDRQLGGVQVYAQVYQGSNQKFHMATIPLSLGSKKGSFIPLFLGENLQTGYLAPRVTLDAQSANRILNEGGSTGLKKLVKGASIDIEDLMIKEFTGGLFAGRYGPLIDRRKYGAWQRSLLEVTQRAVTFPASDRPGLTSHLQAAAAMNRNFALVTNFGSMGKKERENLMLRLGVMPGFSAYAPGYTILNQDIHNEPIGAIGLENQGLLTSMKSISAPSRALFPTTSRLEQITGRQQAFVGSKKRRMGRGGVFAAGPTMIATKTGDYLPTGKNIDFDERITGTINKAMFMDLSGHGRIYRELEGTGAALGTGVTETISPFTKPLLDPGSHGISSSKFLDFITSKYKPGESITLTRAQIEEFGGYMGLGTAGPQRFRMDPRMTGADISYHVTEQYGKRMIHVSGVIKRAQETFKGFSALHKGMVQYVSPKLLEQRLGEEFNISAQKLAEMGIELEDVVLSSGDMLKKGPGYMELQLRSGYGLITGDNKLDQTLKMAWKHAPTTGLGASPLGRTTYAVIQSLAKKGVSAEEAGLVLGAVYSKGEKWHGVKQEDIRTAITEAFGDTGEAVIRAAARGRAIGATSMAQGTGIGDWGRGRGGIENRFLQMLNQRMGLLGIKPAERSEILAGILGRKRGMRQHVHAAAGLKAMAESMAGMTGAIDYAKQQMQGLKTYTLKDLISLSSKTFDQVLAENPEGFILDLVKGADTTATRAMADAATTTFGQGQVFIPGKQVADAMWGTVIKQKEGSVAIADQYSRTVTNFIGEMAGLTTQTNVGDVALTKMQAFKKAAMSMGAHAIMDLSRGKVKGAINLPSYLGTGVALDDRRAAIMNVLHKRTRGRAAYMDTAAFLTQVNDYMGNGKASKTKIREVARMAERFFTGLEEAVATEEFGPGTKSRRKSLYKARGLIQVAARNPMLSAGQVPIVEVFRQLEEVGVSNEYLEKFLQTHRGQKWASRVPRTWREIGQMDSKTRFAFFKDFVRTVGDIAPEGGGKVVLPRAMHKVEFGNRSSIDVDMGVSGAALGDYDGDHWTMMMLNEKTGKRIRSTLSGKSGKIYSDMDTHYKIYSEIFTTEAKEAMERVKDGLVDTLTSDQRTQQQLLQETYAKTMVGQVDVRLNMLRTALMSVEPTNAAEREQLAKALAMLKVVQEHTLIKGKKLPVFRPYAEMIINAVDRAVEDGNFDEFRRIMKDEVFKGSQLWTDGLELKGVRTQGQQFLRNIGGQNIGLEDTMALLKKATAKAQEMGLPLLQSAQRLTRALDSNDPAELERILGLLNSGETMQAGILQGAAGDWLTQGFAKAETAINRMISKANVLESKVAGKIALGLAGSALALGVLTQGGFEPEPLEMGSTTINQELKDRIAASSMFGRDQTVPPSQFRQLDNPYSMTNRPLNMGSTYVTNPNSYQVRGGLTSGMNFNAITNYMGVVSGGSARGNISVNDMRRPITPNYVDQLLGEY